MSKRISVTLPEDLHRRLVLAKLDGKAHSLEALMIEGAEALLEAPGPIPINSKKELTNPGTLHETDTNGTIRVTKSPPGTISDDGSDEKEFPYGLNEHQERELRWYMRKIAEILACVSVDEELALRLLVEAVEIKVKVNGGSIQIAGSPKGKTVDPATGDKKRLDDASVQERVGELEEIADEHHQSPGDPGGTHGRKRRKAR